MTHQAGFRIRRRMIARPTDEEGRVSSPLELLFDLTFVVAISQLVAQLAHAIETGNGIADIEPFLMVFFAIWWAWMNFTWFASSYDTDDVPYRIATMVQMAGVLVLAAGVPAAFTSQDFLGITLGYLIMRIGLVWQWIRAAIDDPATRPIATRYAVGVSVVQLGWVTRLLLPASAQFLVFFVLVALDVSVPFWADRRGRAQWHPHHIAERYGLFTIILLGESVAAATTGVQAVLAHGLNWSLVMIGAAALVIVFALWWIYFLEPAGAGLEKNRGRSYLWGYGHYFVFASLAAVGTGLEVAVRAAAHPRQDVVVTGYALAVPVALFLAFMWAAHAPIVVKSVVRGWIVLPAACLILLAPLVGVLALAVGLIAVITVGVIVAALLSRRDQRERQR